MNALQKLLDTYRQGSKTEREKGFYFEQLVKTYLLNEPSYKDLFNGKVFLWEEWRKYWISKGNSDPNSDAGIDLVAVEDVADNPRIFAIQAKFYAEDSKIRKDDGIDSFLSAMGKKPFTNGLLFLTTYKASTHVIDLMMKRDKPVNIISLTDLEGSLIDWSKYQPKQNAVLKPKKKLLDHQVTALSAVQTGLKEADRGKMIMACGTGKTFTSLKIAEKLAGKNKRVLFLVPSLSLLSQTLTEWTQESDTPLHSFAVCSDSDVGKKHKGGDDFEMLAHELRYPATTEPKSLASEMEKRHDKHHMSVVFSTYHSIDVISKAQHKHDLADFDLIICDEAHRTTGATFDDEDESNFVKVHDTKFIRASKRLYMTATPRIYGEMAKASAEKDNIAICSMDDEKLYGKELYVLTFSEAVSRKLLVDYKVVVLAVDEAHINSRLQKLLSDENNQLKVDDAARIVGCWKALSKQGIQEELVDDREPMHRAVAFCQVIEYQQNAKTHKVSSKNIAAMFQNVVEAYQEQEQESEKTLHPLTCEAEHVDGSMNASEKEKKLDWLKAETPDNVCRILSNVRCLSEGVDVPALDAVLFLTPRNSQVDVVQSVGRVMRISPGKKRGYVILPVVIPVGVEPHEALNDNKTYRVVWQVLQALRSHDDRFDAMINIADIDLNKNILSKMEIIAITDKISKKANTTGEKRETGKGKFGIGEEQGAYKKPEQGSLRFEIGEIERAIYAKLVQKCGNRRHWEDWANDIAKIAQTHIGRITAIIEDESNKKEIKAFNAFADELRDDLNDSITNDEVVEMLAQHLITRPVFDALFKDYDFAKNNSISCAMQSVLDVLQKHHLEKEADTLNKFYGSVKMRAEGIDNAQGKQKIIVELYDKFFRNAFPKMTERLGIVYTPVEVVDFIIHSVNDILQSEFGQTLGSDNVHIIDPFVGTGTFITRLLQSGLIDKRQLPHKYANEIHANEIILLAYYIAAINIESVYHDIMGADKYEPFKGICLTDTFQLYEKEDLISELLIDNSDRRKKQKKLDIRVIMGNPPYSVGQDSANDNNQNIAYPYLDNRIRKTYVERSNAIANKALYDSYIRAIRWASDRIGNSGVIGFVTNGGFIEASTADGLRKCLAEEFSNIYVFHLRGNQRTSGEMSRKEGGKIFGGGSRTPIAITMLVKNPAAEQQGKIYWHDIGDYLSREEKLKKVRGFASVDGIADANGWKIITPDLHGDWLRQRDEGFANYIVLGDKKGDAPKLFDNFSQGVLTARDSWCYNASHDSVAHNMAHMIKFYNSELARFNRAFIGLDKKAREDKLDDQIDTDRTKISWTRSLRQELAKGNSLHFDAGHIAPSLYRPFTKQWLYFDRKLNEYVYQMPRIFPNAATENLVIMIKQRWTGAGQLALITNSITEFQIDGGTQCFPLYLYEKAENDEIDFDSTPQNDMFVSKQASKQASRMMRHPITYARTESAMAA